ncbi:DUF6491 family protein [Parvularcula dongshanensis]|uniref:Uncharacterized protein n=1 Tax=Parvularcula dongshanensis TaxID=1173995 RepID=A0A840I369_9PROT|nr:DUF6491 family protein [Parvularcula dongshanensis]MBB4658742.1 hypothetical protein [Parvularcula dongshanensis]
MRIQTVLPFLLLAACTTTDGGGGDETLLGLDDPRIGAEVGQVCFLGSIDGFSEWDQGEGVVLRKGPQERYLATIRGVCQPLEFVQRVGFDPRGASQSCLTQGDYLFVSSAISPLSTTDSFDNARCLVDGLYEWSGEAPDGETLTPTDDAAATES